eukprot:gnl/MRDRNA2_/MRDRNA2_165844_c0_seq1.p1 gnl/MRDRNA2_/MRDRNA2_165844_c0~~gnl/MRDRNA2_/MRDRNA2_165844_c0_seq1.p1  ORF type:complete len:123 (+),score=22.54 gnl/MRDRNA2_/MRDRNA2_165844_c0_seq1:99-467(+)
MGQRNTAPIAPLPNIYYSEEFMRQYGHPVYPVKGAPGSSSYSGASESAVSQRLHILEELRAEEHQALEKQAAELQARSFELRQRAVPCHEQQAAVLQCYTTRKDDLLNCAGVVASFAKCAQI